MVQVDGGDDADLPALLVLELLGNGLILDGAGLIHVDGAGVGLVAGGDGGGGGGGVGGEGVGVIGDGGAGSLKVHEVEVLGAVEDGALVVVQTGLGLPVVLVLQGAQVVGGGLDLGVAHAVADEQEDVLGGLDGRGRSGSQSGGMRFLRTPAGPGRRWRRSRPAWRRPGHRTEVRLRFFSCLFVPPNFSWTVCDRWVKAILAALR